MKKILASHLPCLKKVKSNPICIPASRRPSSSSISTNPFLSPMPSVILSLTLRGLCMISKLGNRSTGLLPLLFPLRSQRLFRTTCPHCLNHHVTIRICSCSQWLIMHWIVLSCLMPWRDSHPIYVMVLFICLDIHFAVYIVFLEGRCSEYLAIG